MTSGYAVFAASSASTSRHAIDIGDGHVFFRCCGARRRRVRTARTESRPRRAPPRRSRNSCRPVGRRRPSALSCAPSARAARGPDGISYGGRANVRRASALELRILAPQRVEDGSDLPRRVIARFTRQRAPFHLQQAPIRIAAQLPAAVDDRRVQRRRSHQRVRRPRLQLAIERLEPVQHPAHPHDRVAAVARDGCRAPRGRASRPRARRTPCAPTPICRSVGSVTTAASARHRADQRVGADARVLLVDDGGDDQPPAREAAFGGDAGPRRSSPRRPPSCPARRGRRAGRRAPRGRTAPASRRRRRCRCGRRTSAIGPGSRPSSTPMTFGRPGATSCSSTSSRSARMCAAMASATCASPAAPGTSDGLTESIDDELAQERDARIHGHRQACIMP